MFDTLTGAELATAIAGVDRDACNGYQLKELFLARRRLIAWAEAESLRDVELLAYTKPGPDDGPAVRTKHRDPHIGDVVAAMASWTRYSGEIYAAVADQLTELPGTLAALTEGRIDLPKVKVITAGVAVLEDPADRQKVESAVLDRAEEKATSWLRAEVAKQVVRIDPDAAAERHERRVEERGVDIYPDEDSTGTIRVHGLPADEVAEADAYLRAIADTHKAHGDPRSRSQLKADLASALLRGKATAPKPGRQANAAKLVLVAPIPTLLGLSQQPATLGGFGPVITEIARRLIAKLAGDPDSTLCWAATDPATGHAVHTGRIPTRFLRGLLQEHVKIRDGTCRFYNCRHPAIHSRADHTVNHADGGPTCSCNGGSLCSHHDTVKQSGTWQLTQPEPGHFEWTDPHGRIYTVAPDQLTDPIATVPPDAQPF